MDDPYQVNGGTWGFVSQTNPQTSGFVWSRISGTNQLETFVSKSQGALPFRAATTLTPRAEQFADRAAFLAWACQQLGGGLTYTWDYTCAIQAGTHNCG